MGQPQVAFWAGKKALAKIRESGLRPDDVNTVAGAAGGPKWLVLGHLDRALFGSWLQPRKDPLFLIGSSIGAWRLATISHTDPLAAMDRFGEAYLQQCYTPNPSPAEVDLEVKKVLERVMKPQSLSEILAHPFFRLSIMAVRRKGITGDDRRGSLLSGLLLAAAGNALFRGSLRLFFERTLFYDPRDVPPFYSMKGFPIHRIPLNSRNLKPALLASGSIPMIMPGIRNIPDAPEGVYRDGGILDYHMNIPFMNGRNDIVLFPHYAERIIPGWLDKQIPWRKPDLSLMDHLLLVAPSRAFLERLPFGKIPDRTDFREFQGKDRERISYWKKVIDLSRSLADEFMEAVETGRIAERVRPISKLVARK